MVIGEQAFTPHYPVEVDEPITILLSPNILKALKASKFDGTLMIFEDQISFATTGSATITDIRPTTKFPDVSAYLPSAIDFDMIKPSTGFSRVNLDLLAQVSKLRAPSDDRTDNPVFDLYMQEMTDTGKPKPIIVTRAARSLMAVIQPMYVK
jgi:hypothetical protein